MLQLIEIIVMILGPVSWFAFLGEQSQWLGDGGVTLDES